jgi:hypothetical protein
MVAKMNRRVVITIALLSGIVLGGLGMLFARLRPYWVATYHGGETERYGLAGCTT